MPLLSFRVIALLPVILEMAAQVLLHRIGLDMQVVAQDTRLQVVQVAILQAMAGPHTAMELNQVLLAVQ